MKKRGRRRWRHSTSLLKQSLITVEGEAVITQAQRQRQNISVSTVAVDNGLTFMGHGLQLTCLWPVLLYVLVADAATFSSTGHTTPTRRAERATAASPRPRPAVLLYTKQEIRLAFTHKVRMFLVLIFLRGELILPLGCKVTDADTQTPVLLFQFVLLIFSHIQSAFASLV